MANNVDITATQQLLADSKWCRLIEKMDSDADKAKRAAKGLLGNSDIAVVPDLYASELIRCAANYDDADTAFRKACVAVTNGKCGSKAFTKAFMEYATGLEALQNAVACCAGIIKAKPLIVFEEILVAAAYVADSKVRQMAALNGNLEALVAALKKAQSVSSKAQWARALNAALSAATLTLAPEAALSKVAIALSAILGHFAIDNFLGPNGVTINSANRTVIGDAPDVIEGSLDALSDSLEKVTAFIEDTEEAIGTAAKGLGMASAVLTLKADSDEVEEAQDAVAEAQEALEAARKSVEFARRTMSPLVRQLPQIEKALAATSKAVQQAIASASDASTDYGAAMAMVKQL